MNAGFQNQDTKCKLIPINYQALQFMNPDIMYYQMWPYYSQFFTNYYLPQQQLLPHTPLLSQIRNTDQSQQCMMMQNVNTVNKIGDSHISPKIIQNSPPHPPESPIDDKSNVDNEESLSRVNGHWTKHEHQLYLEFVRNHEPILRSKYDKKSKKVFKLMSQFIPTRTATQCRSHHQKFNPLSKGKKKNKQAFRQAQTTKQTLN